jgi:hypothetical protein
MAHRLAYLYMTGEWPPAGIDHRDTNRSNNRWNNLRAATQLQNSTNSSIRIDNTSGYKGVYWHIGARKWRAQIVSKGKIHLLGYFSTPQAAHRAYCEAAIRLHGEFARFS